MKGEGIAIKFYRVENWCYRHHLELFAKVVFRFMQIVLGCTIPYTCEIEGGGKNRSFSWNCFCS